MQILIHCRRPLIMIVPLSLTISSLHQHIRCPTLRCSCHVTTSTMPRVQAQEGERFQISLLIKQLILTRLISIMLSRLRMTVDECIDEYKTLGDKVFGHPRVVSSGGVLWHKLDCKVFEKVIRDVTEKHSIKSTFESTYAMDRLDQDMCQWYVIAFIFLTATDMFENKYSTCICRHWH